MPERAKAVTALACHLEGGVSFNSINETAILGSIDGQRRTVPIDDYYERYDGAFVKAMDQIDWARVLLEATRRHSTIVKDNPDHQMRFEDYGDELCGERCARCSRPIKLKAA